MKKILACIDASSYSASVTEHAAWAAGRLEASVEILHVIQRKDAVSARHDLSGAVGLGAKSSLLEELVQIEETEAKHARERGKIMLAAAREHLLEAGVAAVETTHRHGGTVETIIEREADADVVILGKRGASSQFATNHLGSRVERVIRESIRPVLMASREFSAPERALIAFDGGASSRKAVEFAGRSPLFEGLEIDLVMAGRHSSGEAEQLAWAKGHLPQAHARHLDAAPDEAIPAFVAESNVGLVVMGAYGHSPLRRFIVGSTTTQMMQRCHAPLLLFR